MGILAQFYDYAISHQVEIEDTPEAMIPLVSAASGVGLEETWRHLPEAVALAQAASPPPVIANHRKWIGWADYYRQHPPQPHSEEDAWSKSVWQYEAPFHAGLAHALSRAAASPQNPAASPSWTQAWDLRQHIRSTTAQDAEPRRRLPPSQPHLSVDQHAGIRAAAHRVPLPDLDQTVFKGSLQLSGMELDPMNPLPQRLPEGMSDRAGTARRSA
ncbi:hypothetical protein ACIPSE_31825 [Streptomyces sp. NPDC090106]|uniref:hypothetical protein n=1 Tax=Streptomyces sp. NPDC090106 TaxID=3365946 RepID=UPI0038224D47